MRNFFGNLRYRFSTWMQGRYGNDEFGKFLSFFALALFIISFFSGLWAPLYYLYFVALAVLLYSIFRTFSKNFEARSKERDFYVKIKGKVVGFFKLQVRRIREGKTHRFYRCPKCKTVIRVPKGKGKIQITCPRCHDSFIKTT